MIKHLFKRVIHLAALTAALVVAAAPVFAADSASNTAGAGYLEDSLRGFSEKPDAFSAPDVLPSFFEVVASLGFVLVLIYLLYWGMRRWQVRSGLGGGSAPQGAIQVLEKNFLDNRRGIAVVELGGEIFYLGLGDDVTVLGRVSEASEVERIRALAPSPGAMSLFPQQMEKVADYLRRNQVDKNRETLRDGIKAVQGSRQKLKSRRGGGEK